MTWRQMIGVGVRRVVLARGELDKLEGPKYAARRAELRRKEREAASNTCAFTDDVGAGVPFGCIVTADGGITTGVSSASESSSPASSRSALYVQYVRRPTARPRSERHSFSHLERYR